MSVAEGSPACSDVASPLTVVDKQAQRTMMIDQGTVRSLTSVLEQQGPKILHAALPSANPYSLNIHILSDKIQEHSGRASDCQDKPTVRLPPRGLTPQLPSSLSSYSYPLPQVLLIGKSSSGKSTTTNWLLGKRIIEKRDPDCDQDVCPEDGEYDDTADMVLDVDGPCAEGISIGHSFDSTTEFLQAHVHPDHNLALCDTPGFGETRGAEMEVANSVAITRLLKHCPSARIAVLLNGDKMADNNGESLRDMVRLMGNFLTAPETQLQSVIFLYTHCHSTPARLMTTLTKLMRAGHITSQPEMVTVLKHMHGQLKEHQAQLILHPAADNAAEAATAMMQLLASLHPLPSDTFCSPLSEEALRSLEAACTAAKSRIDSHLFQENKLDQGDLAKDLEALRTLSESLSLPTVMGLYASSREALRTYATKVATQAEQALTEKMYRDAGCYLDKTRSALQHLKEYIDLGEVAGSYKAQVQQLNATAKELLELDLTQGFSALCYRLDQLKDMRDNLTDASSTGKRTSKYLRVPDCYEQALNAVYNGLQSDYTAAEGMIKDLSLSPGRAVDLTPALCLILEKLNRLKGVDATLSPHLAEFNRIKLKTDLNEYHQLQQQLQSVVKDQHHQCCELLPSLADEPGIAARLEVTRAAKADFSEHINAQVAMLQDEIDAMLCQLQDQAFAEIGTCLDQRNFTPIARQDERVNITERLLGSGLTERHRQKRSDVKNAVRKQIETLDKTFSVGFGVDSSTRLGSQAFLDAGRTMKVLHVATETLRGVVNDDGTFDQLIAEYERLSAAVVEYSQRMAHQAQEHLRSDVSKVLAALGQLNFVLNAFVLTENHGVDTLSGHGGTAAAVEDICQRTLSEFGSFLDALCSSSQRQADAVDKHTPESGVNALTDAMTLMHSYCDQLAQASASLPSLNALISASAVSSFHVRVERHDGHEKTASPTAPEMSKRQKKKARQKAKKAAKKPSKMATSHKNSPAPGLQNIEDDDEGFHSVEEDDSSPTLMRTTSEEGVPPDAYYSRSSSGSSERLEVIIRALEVTIGQIKNALAVALADMCREADQCINDTPCMPCQEVPAVLRASSASEPDHLVFAQGEDNATFGVSEVNFSALKVLLDALTRMAPLDKYVGAAAFTSRRSHTVEQASLWLKKAEGEFRQVMKADDLEAAQQIVAAVRHLLAIQDYLDVAATHQRMIDDIAEKSDTFATRAYNLLKREDYLMLAQVMLGQQSLLGGESAQAQVDYDAAQKQIVEWLEQKHDRALHILQVLPSKRGSSSSDQIRELASAMNTLEEAAPLANVIGTTKYEDWRAEVTTAATIYVQRFSQKLMKYVSSWNFVLLDLARDDLEHLQACKHVRQTVTELMEEVQTVAASKVQQLPIEIDAFVDGGETMEIDRMLDGLKQAYADQPDWPQGIAVKYPECHKRIQTKLVQLCESVQVQLNNWDYAEAKKNLEHLGTLMASSHVQTALKLNEKTRLDQHLRDLQAEMISERGLREEIGKVQRGLRSFKSADTRCFRTHIHRFLDAQKEHVRRAKHSLSEASAGCVETCDSLLQRLLRYAAAIDDLHGCEEISDMCHDLYDHLATQYVDEAERKMKTAKRKSDWELVQICNARLQRALPVVKDILQKAETSVAATIRQQKKKEIDAMFEAETITKEEHVQLIESLHTVKQPDGFSLSVAFKPALLSKAKAVAASAEACVEHNVHLAGTMTEQFDSLLEWSPDEIKDPAFDAATVSRKLVTLRKNEAALDTDLGAGIDERVSYISAHRHIEQQIQGIAETIGGILAGADADLTEICRWIRGLQRLSDAWVDVPELRQLVGQASMSAMRQVVKYTHDVELSVVSAYETGLNSKRQQNAPGLAQNPLASFSSRLEYFRRCIGVVKQLPARDRQQLIDLGLSLGDGLDANLNGVITAKGEACLKRLSAIGRSRDSIDFGEVVAKLLDLYMVPSNVSDKSMKGHAKHWISKIVDECKKMCAVGKKGDFAELGRILCEADPRGGELVNDLPQFAAYKQEKWQEDQDPTMTETYCLDKMAELNSLSPAQKGRMWKCYQEYANEYDTIKRSGTYKRPHQVIKETAAMARAEAQTASLPVQIGRIAAIWSLANYEIGNLKPHHVQIMAVFKLLRLESEHTLKRIGSWIANLGTTKTFDLLSNQLIQLKTGEGKSVLLGILASVLGLLGFAVDCVCYSKYLSERDKEYFLKVFTALGIENQIEYDTFDKLAERSINADGGVRQMTEAMLSSDGRARHHRKRDAARPKILLIDEVDVFFSDDFYGGTYNPATQLSVPEVTELQQYMWDCGKQGLSQFGGGVTQDQIHRHAAYKKLIQRRPDLRPMLDKEVSKMITDLAKVKSGRIADYVVVGDAIGYRKQDQISTNTFYGYQTLFLSYKHDLEASIARWSGLSISCGYFSFAEMAKTPSPYSLILGVTGTLDCLGAFEQSIVKEDYGIASTGKTPSMYGDKKLTFRHGDDVSVQPDFDQYARKIQEDIMTCTKKGGSALVFFESEEKLKQFTDSQYSRGIPNLHSVTTQTDNVQHYVEQATRSGYATLFSAIHGRGLDFRCFDATVQKNGGMRVLQTFLSRERSEQIQIQGRTARQMQQGSYGLVLLEDDLKANFNVTKQELQQAAATEGGTYTFLDTRRAQICNEEVGRRKQKVANARKLHETSVAYVDALVRNRREEASRILAGWC